MFAIELYSNLSPSNAVNKEISSIMNGIGNLRNGASIIDPVVILEGPQDNTFPTKINYCYIPLFNRYYYITNIVAVEGVITDSNGTRQLWEIHCHVDVLMSYKEEIGQQRAIVAKQENNYNLMLDDGSLMTYQNPIIQTKYFSNPTPFETQEFVLIVAGS